MSELLPQERNEDITKLEDAQLYNQFDLTKKGLRQLWENATRLDPYPIENASGIENARQEFYYELERYTKYSLEIGKREVKNSNPDILFWLIVAIVVFAAIKTSMP